MGKPPTDFIKSAINLISRSKLSVFGGIVISILSPVLFISILIDIQGVVQNPYFGFLIYLVLGPLFLIGLIFVLAGIFLSRGKENIGLFTFEYIEEQLSRPGRYSRIRRHILLTVSITIATVFIVGMVATTGFQYTETNEFCGLFCHQVMEPAYSSYQNSPHSRVSCVECHIGKSSEWLTKAKFSGAKQLLAVVLDSYPRPIIPPIQTLRPERQTCEECHRPEMFHGDKLHIKDRFLPDEKNTHVQTALLMKIGSGGYQGRKAQGIHWHVSEQHQVFYRHLDNAQEDIAEVWLKNGGEKTHFNKTPDNIDSSKSTPGSGEVRQMDCMDCHNRPTHVFRSADEALDEKIMTGAIPRDLPFIKRQALEAVTHEYESVEGARLGIAKSITTWYKNNYPALFKRGTTPLDTAIKGIQQAYMENVFPEMNVQWGTYKDFIGHKNNTGCFRCHGGLHASADGQMISNDCDSCHIILAENEPASSVLNLLKRLNK